MAFFSPLHTLLGVVKLLVLEKKNYEMLYIRVVWSPKTKKEDGL